jgi:UDP-N-acetylglucosamine 2-epimerase (non-hydrolysing)
MNVAIIAGARPNFVKIAPLVAPMRAAGLVPSIIHTGQHYDAKMSQTFFDELKIPHPDVNLGVGSGSHIWQISEVMRRLEAQFTENRPQAVVVVGDVNSTLAAAVTANKLSIPLAHVEAGLRSFDREMPEETNRILTDSISDWLFTSEPSAETNLRNEGVAPERIHFVGNVMIDTLTDHLEQARNLAPHERLGLQRNKYVLLTLHRPSNVDNPERLSAILKAVHRIAQKMPVVFPIHPRTLSRVEKFGFHNQSEMNGYKSIEPLGYLAMLGMMDAARFVMTDSGGIQEETTALGVPCMTLRDNTERPVTIESGSNRLVRGETKDILAAFDDVVSGPDRFGVVPQYWDGKASQRIAQKLRQGIH